MKYLLVLLVLATSAQAEVFTDRKEFEDALPAELKIVHERFEKVKKWADTYQSDPSILPQKIGPIIQVGVAWGSPDRCMVTADTEGRGRALITGPAPCGTQAIPVAGYDVAATQGRSICAFGADFNTWAGVSNQVIFFLDGQAIESDVRLDHHYQFTGFIDESCGTNLRVEVNNEDYDDEDGAYNFRTRDALIGRTQ